MRTGLITGITGSVGQNLSNYLDKKLNVKGISRRPTSSHISYTKFYENEEKYEIFIHLAGKSHDIKKTSNDNEYFEANFELTRKLFDIIVII